MSQIKNPNDSLQDYFDDLLFGEDETAKAPLIQVNTFITSPALNISGAPAKKLNTKPAIIVPDFADPVIEQKEKLQKLLYSAQPKIKVIPPAEAVTVATASPNHFKSDPTEIQEWPIEASAVVIAEVVQPPAVVLQPQEIAHGYQMLGLEWLPNGLPQWAQARFDVLLFKVSGLMLAVPLITLGQIQPITDELTPLFGQADWFMGLLPTASGKIRTVNTAKFVMPERYDESFVKNAKYVVSINGVPWGLAVDSVNQPIRLELSAVNWRTNRSKRPWLAGTIKEHMCALLDVPMIGQMLMDADKNYSKKHF